MVNGNEGSNFLIMIKIGKKNICRRGLIIYVWNFMYNLDKIKVFIYF